MTLVTTNIHNITKVEIGKTQDLEIGAFTKKFTFIADNTSYEVTAFSSHKVHLEPKVISKGTT